MARPEAKRLRIAFLIAIATSVCLVITSAMIILSVAPLLPTPDRKSNLRLGIILALACSATFSSTLLMAMEVINFRNHSRNFLSPSHPPEVQYRFHVYFRRDDQEFIKNRAREYNCNTTISTEIF
ncbi:hypothetical protein GTA08_BOTSDO10967 [Neofusicoccum parvum]|uniref:Uncharacterized protein n=1 Tax=Neofusicoccum parvum TaxID=310453 RepID=A0ACB5SGN0_9PEZI|nr:hypothetical protein GTA08_BOTSDO10967 [Neofusicoccum parvum]